MNSALYRGFVTHRRLSGPAHGFRYPLYMLLLDVDELSALDASLRLFGYNRSRPVAFRESDHFGDEARSARENIESRLRAEGIAPPGGPIRLLTHARVFGHVFNPVSFWWCFDRAGKLRAAVAEVNNTFGDRHAYVLRAEPGRAEWRSKKVMHVSPFFASDAGTYRWELPVPGEHAALAVDLTQEGRTVLAAGLHLTRQPLNDRTLALALLRYPLMTAQVLAAIHFEALRLWAKGATAFRRPPYDPQAAQRGPV